MVAHLLEAYPDFLPLLSARVFASLIFSRTTTIPPNQTLRHHLQCPPLKHHTCRVDSWCAALSAMARCIPYETCASTATLVTCLPRDILQYKWRTNDVGILVIGLFWQSLHLCFHQEMSCWGCNHCSSNDNTTTFGRNVTCLYSHQ